jgi:hypothetical protein
MIREVYNTADDLIEKEYYNYNNKNYRSAYYKYNDKGKVSSIETYFYDDMGRLTETDGLEPEGKLVSRITYKYDENNNLIDKIWYNARNEINAHYKYGYDNNYNLIEEIKFRGGFSEGGEKENRIAYKYNENGIVTEVLRFDTNDKKEKLTKYMYEYY